MLTTKKQSINTRLLFYAKLGDKLDAIGQQLVDILYNLQNLNGQAVTVEQLITQSQVYNSLQFLVTGRKQVVDKSIELEKNLNTNVNEQNSKLSNACLNVYEKYLIDKRPLFNELKKNLLHITKQIVIIFSILLISILVSAIFLSPAFRNQLNLFLIYFINSFNQLIGLDRYLNQRLSSKDYCNLPIVNGLQSAFLPPFNCDYCANLTEISKVTNLDNNQFQNSYLNRLIPVIVQDATQQWSALNEFTVDFLKKIYIETEGSLNYHDQNCQFFPYKTNYYNLADAFNNVSTDHLDWYIGWSNCDSRIANKLRKYYQRPYFLPSDSLLTKTDWLFLGSPGYGAHLHIDNVGNPSWQAQIKGSKIWTIKPPFECLLKCSTLEVQVNPGEIIVLDTNRWYHKTLIVGDEISITIGSEFD